MAASDRYETVKSGNGRKYGHIAAWEYVNGTVPDGYVIHHIDGNRRNNAIENLAMLTPADHIRIHRGWVKDDAGNWLKRCRLCGEFKSVDNDYYRKTSTCGGRRVETVRERCKVCNNVGRLEWVRAHADERNEARRRRYREDTAYREAEKAASRRNKRRRVA